MIKRMTMKIAVYVVLDIIEVYVAAMMSKLLMTDENVVSERKVEVTAV